MLLHTTGMVQYHVPVLHSHGVTSLISHRKLRIPPTPYLGCGALARPVAHCFSMLFVQTRPRAFGSPVPIYTQARVCMAASLRENSSCCVLLADTTSQATHTPSVSSISESSAGQFMPCFSCCE